MSRKSFSTSRMASLSWAAILVSSCLTVFPPVLYAAASTGSTANTALTQAQSPAAAQTQYDVDNDIFHPVQARHGMVATQQALATQVGLNVLKQGGNAVDAAAAVAFSLAAVLPYAGNLGGGGFMMVHDAASGKDYALDFREMAPMTASRNMYLDEKGNVVEGKSLFTHLAVGVPGTVAGFDYAVKRWGSKPLATLIQPAIHQARDGITVGPTLANMLAEEKGHLGQWDSSRAIFFHQGEPLKEGDRLVQKDLAHSMELIARQGAKAFYQGPIADQIVAQMKDHGGLITKADLANYKVVVREPVVGDYHGYRVVSMPPPSSGGIHIIEILNILEHFPLAKYGADSAQSIHYMVEAMKFAYADRAEYLGDPDFIKVPVKGLTSKAYADTIAQRIDPVKVIPSSQIKPGKVQPYESNQTTHFSIVDAKGNAVSVTYTLNWNFGSGIVAKGSGILLNDEMDDFSSKPGATNAYGLVGGDANAIAPKKRPLSSMSPTFVLKDGKPWIVTGTPGGARIITTTLETLVDLIDFGMNPAEAAATPRFHHQWQPDEIRIEKGFSPDTLSVLKQQGYKISLKPIMGKTQTIEVGPHGLSGYSDPRDPEGATLGY